MMVTVPFEVVLVAPEIPPNTGNIIRLCANTGARLHLVKPLGFALDAPSLRRAGLDYHALAEVRVHADLAACLRALGSARTFAIETGSAERYDRAQFSPGDALLFGAETRGLPASLRSCVPPERWRSIPMCVGSRSVNLSNAVALVLYEAWRQNDFVGAIEPDRLTDSA